MFNVGDEVVVLPDSFFYNSEKGKVFIVETPSGFYESNITCTDTGFFDEDKNHWTCLSDYRKFPTRDLRLLTPLEKAMK